MLSEAGNNSGWSIGSEVMYDSTSLAGCPSGCSLRGALLMGCEVSQISGCDVDGQEAPVKLDEKVCSKARKYHLLFLKWWWRMDEIDLNQSKLDQIGTGKIRSWFNNESTMNHALCRTTGALVSHPYLEGFSTNISKYFQECHPVLIQTWLLVEHAKIKQHNSWVRSLCQQSLRLRRVAAQHPGDRWKMLRFFSGFA